MACLSYPLRRMMVAGALLVLCVNALFVSATSTSDYTADQQKNTLAFLKGFAVAGSTLETSWTGTDFCTWPYVRCYDDSGTLTFMDYIAPAFTGSLVLPELGADVNGSEVIFTGIDLSGFGQQVTGSLPASWGRLTTLTSLDLSGNALNGSLPADWGGMAALESLYLNSNRLEGSLPGQWRFLSELMTLRLDKNTLSGTLPAAWFRLTSLSTLYLNDNILTGPLPAAWVALTALWSLDLSNNQLTGSIPERWGELRVYTLVLSNNELCGCIPTKLKNSYYLPTVDPDVSADNCTTANPCEPHSADSASAPDDSEASALLTANEQNTLKFLRLVRAAVGGELQSLWSGVWYCGWWNVKCGSDGLVSVALSDVTFSGPAQLPELTTDIDGSLVDVTSFELYGKGARVTGALPASWGRLTRLRTLDLSGNALTGSLPADWNGMAALKSLYLSSNRLEGSLPGQWRFLSELMTLRLDNNTLSGTLPAGWLRLISLKNLYLNNSALSGTLPEAWASMPALGYLYLSKNQLTGSIPDQWGELRVYTLELSSNRLCGCVPTNLKSRYYVTITVDPAVSADNCTTANPCEPHSADSASAPDDSEASALLTANEQNTLKFLRLVRAAVGGELQSLWSGVWYCSWRNVKCGSDGLVSVALSDVTVSGPAQLPELTTHIDGSLVDVTSFELYDKGARVTGALPASWGRLTTLRELVLNGNALTGSLPANWSTMTKLYTLNLAANVLSGTLPVEWASMPTLTELRLNNNQLAGAIPEGWSNMKSLQDIYLSDNDFCGCVPSAWKGGYRPYVRADDAVTSTKCRTANRCVDGSGSSDSMAGMTEEEKSTLKFLRGFAAKNPFLASRWTGIYYCEWPYVQCTSYSNVLNFNAYSAPAFTGALVLPELGADVNGSAVIFDEIDVSGFGQQVTGSLPASWGRLTHLTKLDVKGNALTGPLPADWSGMSALQTLHMEDNRIEGVLPADWANMTMLKYLYLQNNSLTGSLPGAWSGLAALQELYLSSNRLDGSLPGQWRFLSKLRELRLSSNALTGTLPAEWKAMTSLNALNLSSNALSGSLPADWASVEYLRSLYLAANQFTGSIPREWAAQWTYFTADLSRNHLCGCLPDGWSKQTFLIDITVDAAVSASNCSDKNACDVHNTTTTTAAPTQEQRNTLKFLQAFSTMDPSLAMRWTGSSYCDWAYVRCSADGAVQLDLSPLPLATAVSRTKAAALMKTVTSTAAVSLPELAADVDGQQVAVTDLSVYGKGSRVAGTLPASWRRLARLQTVRVQSNAITGTLPSAWSEMTSLRSLNVSGNALSGGVPDSWGGMTKLVSVDLKGTGLCGCLPEGWKSKTVAADAALTARDCASANACPAVSSTSAPPKKKSGRNLIPLWCVLGAVGGLLVGLAVGFGVRFYRWRQREREVSRSQATQEAEMEPFAKMPDSPY